MSYGQCYMSYGKCYMSPGTLNKGNTSWPGLCPVSNVATHQVTGLLARPVSNVGTHQVTGLSVGYPMLELTRSVG